jgi:hypothetical protein
MGEKVRKERVVGRAFAVAVGIICILGAGQIGLFTYYRVVINIQSAKYTSVNHDQQNTISSLNVSLLNLEKPMLIGVGLKATDYAEASTFQIIGYVVNVGQTAAVNCSLDVYLTVYEVGSSPTTYTGVEKYISLGTLSYEDSVFIDQNISYSGGPLYGWFVLRHWNGQTNPVTPILSS